jgi:membrane fusion protein
MLFRSEVVSARHQQWLGGVQIAQSIPAWLGSFVAVVLAGSLIVYSCLGSYARKARVPGILAPRGGELNITAPVAGRVAELRVQEGQLVEAGDVLLVLDTDRAAAIPAGPGETTGIADTAGLVARQLVLRRQGILNERDARVAQAETRARTTRDRLSTLDSELEKLADEVVLQGQRKALAQRSVNRYEELASSNFVSPIQAQAQQESLLDQDARLRALERSRLNLERERKGLMADLKQINADLATVMASAERELLSLDQEATENSARRTTVVVAPGLGVVSALAVSRGQWAASGQNLAAVQPAGLPLEAQLFAPSRTAGFVSPGDVVLLRYAAYPYQKFGLQTGKVVAISPGAFAPSDLPPSLQAQFGRQSPEALYRVTVALDAQGIQTYGQTRPLKSGMALDADIVQDRRRILEWILEPLFAVAQRS